MLKMSIIRICIGAEINSEWLKYHNLVLVNEAK